MPCGLEDGIITLIIAFAGSSTLEKSDQHIVSIMEVAGATIGRVSHLALLKCIICSLQLSPFYFAALISDPMINTLETMTF